MDLPVGLLEEMAGVLKDENRAQKRAEARRKALR